MAALADGPLVAALANGRTARRHDRPHPGRRRARRPAATDDWPFLYLRTRSWPTTTSSRSPSCCSARSSLVRARPPSTGTTLRRFSPHFFVAGHRVPAARDAQPGQLQPPVRDDLAGQRAGLLRHPRERPAGHLHQRAVPDPAPHCFYAALFVSLAVAFLVPPESLLIDPPWLRYALAAVLAFAPVFFANLVFSHSFRDTRTADMAFASNLLGAMVGGALEYLALITGYQALLSCRGAACTAGLAVRHPLPAAGRPRPGAEATPDVARAHVPAPAWRPSTRGRLTARTHRVARRAAAGVGDESAAARHGRPERRSTSRPCPRSAAARTVRRIAGFFRPYRVQVVVVMAPSSSPASSASSTRTCSSCSSTTPSPTRTSPQLNLYVGLMIVAAHHQRPHRGRPDVPQQRGRPARHAGPAQRALRAPPAACRCASSPRRARARSRAAWPTTWAASRASSPTPPARSSATSSSTVTTLVAMVLARLAPDAPVAGHAALLPVADLPRGQGARGASAARPRRAWPDVSAITEETLSVSGILLSKTFGQQATSIAATASANAQARRAPSARAWSDAGSS